MSSVKNENNIYQDLLILNCYANDHDDWYPLSTAYASVGRRQEFYWQEPTMMTACKNHSSRPYRSMSAYLNSYVSEASIFFSPTAPEEYPLFQEAWDAGDDWDYEGAGYMKEVLGTYCFYWGYVGYLPEIDAPFYGPNSASGNRWESKVLMSDYFGYGHWRNTRVYDGMNAYGSNRIMSDAGVTPGTDLSTAFWSLYTEETSVNLNTIDLTLHAGFIDGHVRRYTPSETVPMRVANNKDGTEGYPVGADSDPGIFYLPREGVR